MIQHQQAGAALYQSNAAVAGDVPDQAQYACSIQIDAADAGPDACYRNISAAALREQAAGARDLASADAAGAVSRLIVTQDHIAAGRDVGQVDRACSCAIAAHGDGAEAGVDGANHQGIDCVDVDVAAVGEHRASDVDVAADVEIHVAAGEGAGAEVSTHRFGTQGAEAVAIGVGVGIQQFDTAAVIADEDAAGRSQIAQRQQAVATLLKRNSARADDVTHHAQYSGGNEIHATDAGGDAADGNITGVALREQAASRSDLAGADVADVISRL